MSLTPSADPTGVPTPAPAAVHPRAQQEPAPLISVSTAAPGAPGEGAGLERPSMPAEHCPGEAVSCAVSPGRPHGYARYRLDGCRCYVCGLARAEYDDRRNRLIAYGQWAPFVPIAETQQRILDLAALGMGDRGIATLAGLNRKQIRDIRTGVRHDPGRGNPPLTKIRSATAAAIEAVPFDPLAGPGGALVDATLTWDRVHALIRAGYPRVWIAEQIGNQRCLQLRYDRVTAANARKILKLVQRVALRPGPSERSRREGIVKDWPLLEDVTPEAPRMPDAHRRQSRHVVSAAEILAQLGEAVSV